MTLQVQFLTLALMAGCGVTLGACFDTIGAAGREFRFHRAVLALIDLAYWAAATIFVFRVLLYANYGEVRFFIFIGLASGVLLYALLVGTWYRRLVVSLIRLFKRLFFGTVRVVNIVLIRPILFLYRLLLRLVLAIAGIIATVSVFLGKIVVKWTRLVWKMIRNRF